MEDDAQGRGAGYPEDMLKEKYADYCSAKVAEALLDLSPDEMYLLAEEAAGGPVVSGSHTYDQIVRLATVQLTRGAALPSFSEWVAAYQESPDQYDELIMGLWKSHTQDVGPT